MRKIFFFLFLTIILSFVKSEAKESEKRLYDLKVKLKPKVSESKVYWRDKINWEEEIKNWKFDLPETKLPEEINRLKSSLIKT